MQTMRELDKRATGSDNWRDWRDWRDWIRSKKGRFCRARKHGGTGPICFVCPLACGRMLLPCTLVPTSLPSPIHTSPDTDSKNHALVDSSLTLNKTPSGPRQRLPGFNHAHGPFTLHIGLAPTLYHSTPASWYGTCRLRDAAVLHAHRLRRRLAAPTPRCPDRVHSTFAQCSLRHGRVRLLSSPSAEFFLFRLTPDVLLVEKSRNRLHQVHSEYSTLSQLCRS